MLPSAHLLAGAATSIPLAHKRLAPGGIILTQLASHYFLDSIPHIEPGLTGTSYLTLGSPAFYWTIGDHLLGVILLAWLWRKHLVVQTRYFWPVAIISWCPDLLVALDKSGWWTNPLFQVFTKLHETSHLLWQPWLTHFPAWLSWSTGTLTTALVIMIAVNYIGDENTKAVLSRRLRAVALTIDETVV